MITKKSFQSVSQGGCYVENRYFIFYQQCRIPTKSMSRSHGIFRLPCYIIGGLSAPLTVAFKNYRRGSIYLITGWAPVSKVITFCKILTVAESHYLI
jgi:hypothetical protein